MFIINFFIDLHIKVLDVPNLTTSVTKRDEPEYIRSTCKKNFFISRIVVNF